MTNELPRVRLVHPHEIQVRGRILDGGKLREITGTARSADHPKILEVHTRWLGIRKVIKLRETDVAAVTEPYE